MQKLRYALSGEVQQRVASGRDCLAKPRMRPFLGGVEYLTTCVPGASESIHAGQLSAEVNDVSIPVPSEDILVFEKAS